MCFKQIEPAHHTASVAKQDRTANSSTEMLEQFSHTGCHLDFDHAALWTRLLDVHEPPSVLSTGHESLYLDNISRFPLSTERPIDPLPIIEGYFCPSSDSGYFLKWTGPDLLSSSTSADDVFHYLSKFYLSEKSDWADIRLCVLSNATEEIVAVYPFFLLRTESILGNLSRVRKLLKDSMGGHDVEKYHFRFTVRPCSQEAAGSVGAKTTFGSYDHPVVPFSSLDPCFFVQNILGNYKN
ncbi:hypothetical protein N7471_010629 [Penicillium samsonianum]|uniref:uncharacterized protein n=1 Tax=Penicillium samsonianum TaxID=1882272 RepID=UPI0025484189|nr:uncharacterized protein N7471_010629 [Penicillium samsonianum]KAJ6126136.1 hypothetical protein N7471_010629 [Penicillium samsonianum]